MKQASHTRQIVLDMKIARVIALYGELHGMPLEEAADVYYRSVTSNLVEKGAGDLHCRSDRYLADELWLEVTESREP